MRRAGGRRGRRRRSSKSGLNHGSVLCIFPMVVWLAEQPAASTQEECVVELAPAPRD